MTQPQPIATAPRDGKLVIVGDEAGNIAAAFWHAPAGRTVVQGGQERPATIDDGMWAYCMPEGDPLVMQIDFEPTHWAETAQAFMPEPLTPPQT